MRLTTGFVTPEENGMNKRAIGRGERAKGDREQATERYPIIEACGAVGPRERVCRLTCGHKGGHLWRRT